MNDKDFEELRNKLYELADALCLAKEIIDEFLDFLKNKYLISKESKEKGEKEKKETVTEEVEKLEEEVEEKEEGMAEKIELPRTESEAVQFARKLEDLLKKLENADNELAFETIEKLRPLIKRIIDQRGYENIPELYNALWYYKSLALPLATRFGKSSEYAFLKRVKCPINVIPTW